MTQTLTPSAETYDRQRILKQLQVIPGIGPRMSQDLWDLGYRSVDDLQAEDPEHMYRQLRAQAGGYLDRCVLYVFRCAVYYAETEEHDPELLKWWNWKDRELPR
jgi:hypothetical protein